MPNSIGVLWCCKFTDRQWLWHYGGAELLLKHYGWGAKLPLKHYCCYDERMHFLVGFLKDSLVDIGDLFEDSTSVVVAQLVLVDL